ncbi:MAG: DegT/DnrJ/EryC1/StrS family aminotransferase [Candidatus Hydrogenedentes bacterium]|nr:DegT/DnrJ/EryC1/StrS family aminotransferase [Candidatus Hydrogenedentota bacterium]
MADASWNYDPFKARTFVQTATAALPELDTWQQIGEEEVAMVAEMTRRNELSGGTPIVREFEEAWRKYIGSRFCVSVINGTSALYSAYFGMGIGPGDEVICPVNTWICTISPALLLGAKPVFCDIDPETLMLDPEDVKRKITDKTRCIVPVHLWGNVCDMDALLAIGKKHTIPVLEDCSHAHGAKYKGAMCGTLGIAGCWSLQGSKAMSAGEGGVITTDDVDLFERACLVGQVNRIQGIDLVTEKYTEHQPLGLGMKFRAHPLGIGIALVQMKKLDALNARRKAYIEAVEQGLAEISCLRPVAVYQGVERAGYYGFPIIYEAEKLGGTPASRFLEAINAQGLNATMSPYPNLHELPLFAKGFDVFTRNRGPLCASEGYKGYQPGDFPNAELAAKRTIFLPRLSDPIENAAQIVLDALKRAVDSV